MIVYGDLLFLINFSMDFLCFYLSCVLLHQRMPTLRAFAASALGGIYSVASLFIVTDRAVAFAADILVLILMCLMVYASRNTAFGQMLRSVLLYLFVSALLGGVMTALFSLFNRIELFGGESAIESGIDVWIFALLAVLASFFTLKGGRFFASSSSKRSVAVEIESERGVTRIKALVDSGNLACEPISGKTVIFATLECCKEIMDEDMYRAFSNGVEIENLPLSIASKIRLVPSRMIEGKALLPSVRFKSVRLISSKREKELDVYIAFLKENTLGGYDAVISNEALA